MADETTYHEALDQYANVTTLRERFGRKVFRGGQWVSFDPMLTLGARILDTEARMARKAETLKEDE